MIYTKEPWEIRKNTSNTYILAKDGNGNAVTVACVFPRGIAGCETEGNANLMKAAPKTAEALQASKSVLLDIQQRESKTSFHGQRVASDCGEAIKVIDEALAEVEGKGE